MASNDQSVNTMERPPTLLDRIGAVIKTHPHTDHLRLFIGMFERSTVLIDPIFENTLLVEASWRDDELLQAFECRQQFKVLVVRICVAPPVDTVDGADDVASWDRRLCRALESYPFEGVGYEVTAPEVVEEMMETRFYMNALVRAALSNKSVEGLLLFANCPNQLLQKSFTEEPGAGPSAFEALLLPGHSAITTLHVRRWPLSPRDMQILASDSPSLQTLVLSDLHKSSTTAGWLVKFLRLLESNTSLHHLAILDSPGADVPEVYKALIQLLKRTSSGAFEGVELWWSGRIALDQKNEALRRRFDAVQCKRNPNGAQWALRDFPKVKPSSIRIFFCGSPFAGKTTLRRNMVNVLQQRSSRWLFKYIAHPSLLWIRAKEPSITRTTGIEVTPVNHNGLEISFWDLAGQKEFHAFHDLFMPNEPGPSLFLVVCSIISNPGLGNTPATCKTREDLLAELNYWLRYISSTTRQDSPFEKPSVIFIFTHLDKLESHWQKAMMVQANDVKDEVQSDFNLIADHDKQNIMFCLDSHNINDVSKVVTTILSESERIRASCEDIHKVCDDAKKLIAEQIRRHPDETWVPKNALELLIEEKIVKGPVTGMFQSYEGISDITRAIVHHLHQTGSIIYFKECDIVLLNLQWFCKDFMGGIIAQSLTNSSFTQSQNGFWEREVMSATLESILYPFVSPEGKGKRAMTEEVYQRDKKSEYVVQLIGIMKQLELCFEVNKDGRSGLFIPATLTENDERTLRRWTANFMHGITNDRIEKFGFVGRRLMCKDEEHTFLTPGLFPRLQVHLRNVFMPTYYRLERDLIKIVDDNMEVIIEFNDMPLSFIDIMVRFPAESKDGEDAVFTFINNVISGVQDLQRDSGCWGGVELVEAALRASCLQKLTPPQHKGKEFATIEHLRGKIRNSDAIGEIERTTHTWGALKASDLSEECVQVVSLLGKRDYLCIMEERFTQLEELSKCLGVEGHRANYYASSGQCPATGDSQMISEMHVGYFSQLRRASSFLGERDANMYRFGSQVEMLGSKVDMLKTEVIGLRAEVRDIARDIKNGVEILKEQKERLLPEIRRILGELRNASSTEATSDIPKFFMFEDEISRHLVCKLVPGVRKYRLRFMCESEPMPHVPEQAGMKVTTLGEGAVRCIMPYLQKVLWVLAVGLRVGAPVAQLQGLPVPDLSSFIDELLSESRSLTDSRDEMVGNVGAVASAARARTWVKGLMEQEGCYHDENKMYNMFGLGKCQLPDGRWVWLCDRHQT